MQRKKLLLYLIIFVSIIGIHLFPINNNHFFFTTDQGDDSLAVREIVERHKFQFKGPETSIRGVFAGPGWYYFLSLGYFLFRGNPLGGVFMLIVSNALFSILLIDWLSKKIGLKKSLVIGISLQTLWGFFYSSLWAFNPFPLVALAFWLIIGLTSSLGGSKKSYFLALIPILIAFNTNVAGAMAFLFFYLLVSLWLLFKKIIKLKTLAMAFSPFLLIGVAAYLGKFFLSPNFKGEGLQVFSTANYIFMIKEFMKMVSETTFPQNYYLGVLIFLIVSLLFLTRFKEKSSIRRLIYLSFGLFLSSFIFFGSNKGWRDWHTVYLPPLIFTSLLLMLVHLPKKISVPIFVLILFAQILNTIERTRQFMTDNKNPSLLTNEIKVINSVYQESEQSGFAVYNYTDTYFDQPYQYLFYWYGLKKYGFLPCEYSNFPLSHKNLYVPGFEHYLDPRRACDRIKFLLIQSDTNGEKNKDWIAKFRTYHNLVKEINVGDIKVEKYYSKRDIPNDYCIWWNRCN